MPNVWCCTCQETCNMQCCMAQRQLTRTKVTHLHTKSTTCMCICTTNYNNALQCSTETSIHNTWHSAVHKGKCMQSKSGTTMGWQNDLNQCAAGIAAPVCMTNWCALASSSRQVSYNAVHNHHCRVAARCNSKLCRVVMESVKLHMCYAGCVTRNADSLSSHCMARYGCQHVPHASRMLA